MAPDAGTTTRDRILLRLKRRGPQTAAQLAVWLRMTPMGARQHLEQLQDEELVAFETVPRGVGRPARHWRLTRAGNARFPQGYAHLTVEILSSVRQTFGPRGLERLIAQRGRKQLRLYRERVPAGGPLARRVAALGRLRCEEGYMAEWVRGSEGSFTLVENHCPIYAAAEVCQGLCAGELELFRDVLGEGVQVERVEHLLTGARRCAYRIQPATSGAALAEAAPHRRGGKAPRASAAGSS